MSVGFDGKPEEEEVCDPDESCKSWGAYATLKDKPVSELPLEEPLSPRFHFKQRMCSGIDEERHLYFKLRPGDFFGLELADAMSGTANTRSVLIVASLEGRSTLAKTADGQDGVSAGDVIVEVNGRRGSAEEVRNVLLQALASDGHFFHGQLNMVVRPRPLAFDVEMVRQGRNWQTLGITLVIDKNNPRCALVQSLSSEGLVPDWNKSHGSLQICAGDLISHVNDLNGDVAAMCREIRMGSQGSVLRFRIVTSVAGQAAARRVACENRRSAPRRRAEEAQAQAQACVDAERLARVQGLRHEVESLALEAIRWDMDIEDTSEEVPPPLVSPARRGFRQDGLKMLVERSDEMQSFLPPLMSPMKGLGHKGLDCEEDDETSTAGSQNSEESRLRHMLEFALESMTPKASLRGEVASAQRRQGHEMVMFGETSPKGDAIEDHEMSDASTDFPLSGEATPALGTSSCPRTPLPGKTVLWV